MAWLRDTDERFERRPPDALRLALATVLAIVVGVWAQSESSLDTNLFLTVNSLGSALEGAAKAVYYGCGSIVTVLVVAFLLWLAKQVRAAWQVALAGGVAWGIARLLNEILGTHSIKGVPIHVRVGDGPSYPVVNVAVAMAIMLAVSPYVVRPLRRLLVLLVLGVALAAIYLGAGFPSDVLGGLFVATAVVALMRVVFGSVAGRPTIAEVRAAVVGLGYDVADVRFSNEDTLRASIMDVDLADGRNVRVEAFGRDQRDARFGARLWHRLNYKEPSAAIFGSRVQQTEHVAYTLLLAARAGVAAPTLDRTGVGGDDIALLVTVPPKGRALQDLQEGELTDALLANLWRAVGSLHDAGLSHGNLDPIRIVVQADGTIAFDDFSAADDSGDPYYTSRDDAAVVTQTALAVGNERATAAALAALGAERLGEVIPYVQPAALPKGVGRGTKHLGKALKELRADLATAAGVEHVETIKLRRLSWYNIGITAGILLALVLALNAMEGVNWSSVEGEFENAIWGWALLVVVLYPLVPMSWATALMGCVNQDLPFVPTVLTQVACSFLNLITPNGIGGTALQVDYLYKQGVPPASAGSAMVLSTGVGGAIQMALFLIALAITGSTFGTSSSSSSSTNTLLAIAVVAALIGIVLFVPKIRGKVVPAVKKAALDIWAVARNPRKLMQLFGGDLAGNLVYPFLLGLCLLAFHQHLDFAELVVVQVGAGMLGNVAPVPGGIGVQMSALLAGLTAFGIPAAPATAAVILFRGITFAIPPIFGFFTLRWLRAQGYA